MSDEHSSQTPTRVVIVGGGPAGSSAAVFTARAGLATVVIDADKGMTRRAWVANHLGFPEGLAGPDLVDGGRAQAERAGATWVEGTVEAIEGAAGGFTVRRAEVRLTRFGARDDRDVVARRRPRRLGGHQPRR